MIPRDLLLTVVFGESRQQKSIIYQTERYFKWWEEIRRGFSLRLCNISLTNRQTLKKPRRIEINPRNPLTDRRYCDKLVLNSCDGDSTQYQRSPTFHCCRTSLLSCGAKFYPFLYDIVLCLSVLIRILIWFHPNPSSPRRCPAVIRGAYDCMQVV